MALLFCLARKRNPPKSRVRRRVSQLDHPRRCPNSATSISRMLLLSGGSRRANNYSITQMARDEVGLAGLLEYRVNLAALRHDL